MLTGRYAYYGLRGAGLGNMAGVPVAAAYSIGLCMRAYLIEVFPLPAAWLIHGI